MATRRKGDHVIGYAKREIFTVQVLDFLKIAQNIVEAVPEEMRCHELARVVGFLLPIEANSMVVDGWYGIIEHSWIMVNNGTAHRVLLDPYVPGRLPQAQLIDAGIAEMNYISGIIRTDIDHVLVEKMITKYTTWNKTINARRSSQSKKKANESVGMQTSRRRMR